MIRCKSNRSGPACKNRMEELIKRHKKHESKKRQATGSSEEVNQFCEDMEEICMRQDCPPRDKVVSVGALKRKDNLEVKGDRIRNAVTQGFASKSGIYQRLN